MSAILFFVGCGNEQAKKPNIIMISIDTLRSDRLGCYGYTRPTSPNLDRFAESGLVFLDVLTQSTLTPPSHAAIFSSTYPFQHDSLFTESTSLAGILRENGYKTAAFVDDGKMRKIFRLNKGFDIYEDWARRGIKRINEEALKWLEENDKFPFFLFLHCYDVHCPYDPPQMYIKMFDHGYSGKKDFAGKCGDEINKMDLDEKDILNIQDRYDAGIRYTDEHIGELLRNLEQKGIFSNTVVIILSDHGESLGERRDHYVDHNKTYEYQLKVPLIIHFPSGEKGRIEEPVQLIDVMPTILEYAGIKNKHKMEGISLLPIIRGKFSFMGQRVRLSEAGHAQTTFTIRKDDSWKLVLDKEGDTRMLIDLKNDPTDEGDCYRDHPVIAKDLETRLSEIISSQEIKPYFKPNLDSKSMEQLKSLGYIQ